jgi:hypothetical protein
VDRALGTRTVADALRERGCRVEIHDQHFSQAAKDAEWLPEVGRRSWVLLTKDRHIRTRQNELVSLLAAGVGAFVLTAGDLSGPEMAHLFFVDHDPVPLLDANRLDDDLGRGYLFLAGALDC